LYLQFSLPILTRTQTRTLTIAKMAAADTAKTFDIPKKYKAVVYDKPGSISTKIEELDTPEPGPGDVLVRL